MSLTYALADSLRGSGGCWLGAFASAMKDERSKSFDLAGFGSDARATTSAASAFIAWRRDRATRASCRVLDANLARSILGVSDFRQEPGLWAATDQSQA